MVDTVRKEFLLLSATDVHYSYGRSSGQAALQGASLHVRAGESVSIVGPSGAGKTTLLYCLAGVVVPTSGEICLGDVAIHAMDADGRARLRLERFGFVFQFGDLVPELTLLENVEMPLTLSGVRPAQARRRALDVLDRLDVATLANRRPGQVSGGQAQRCAVARAVVHRPSVVFADEPTGALDSATGAAALEELLRLSREHGSAVVVVTHDRDVAARTDRQVEVKDGQCH